MENNRLNKIKKKTVDKVFNSVFHRYDLMNDLMSIMEKKFNRLVDPKRKYKTNRYGWRHW